MAQERLVKVQQISKEEDARNRRRVERIPVYNTTAHIKCGINDESPLHDLHGLVVNLSSQGCCIIVHTESIPDNFSFCRVTIGHQILVPSQIRWLKQIGENTFKIGFMYQV